MLFINTDAPTVSYRHLIISFDDMPAAPVTEDIHCSVGRPCMDPAPDIDHAPLNSGLPLGALSTTGSKSRAIFGTGE
jgi:hypothetical protein